MNAILSVSDSGKLAINTCPVSTSSRLNGLSLDAVSIYDLFAGVQKKDGNCFKVEKTIKPKKNMKKAKKADGGLCVQERIFYSSK